MKRAQAFPSQYMSKEDVLMKPLLATIADVKMEGVQGDSALDEKPVMHFREEGIKKLVLNNTNWQTIEEVYGEETDDWAGKVVELYHEPNIIYQGKKVGGVRVRIPPQGGSHAASAVVGVDGGGLFGFKAACAMTGMTAEALATELKKRGLQAGATPSEFCPVVRKIMAERAALPDTNENVDDTIPF